MREVEHVLIRLPDGTNLAARLWLPADATPVPAILEYLPYRKRDGTRVRDALTHPFFAAHGYAAIRVDIRGSGESEGLLADEYTQQELDDALAVIAWIAGQPWCDGHVGMMGISWGGFNALQVAALSPPALDAIISLCSTDDRYADDVHFMGGALLTASFGWAMALTLFGVHPPDPRLVTDWRAEWLKRLANVPLYVAPWLCHAERDAYWRHGSVAEQYSAIRCPVFLIGGWTDAYSNAIPRLLAKLSVPRQALIGPWAHAYPHFAQPGPRAGFLEEALAWWDRWLKGRTDAEAPPLLRAWMMESVRPQPHYAERPGRWIAERMWPPETTSQALYLTARGLAFAPDPAAEVSVHSPQHVGAAGGSWCPFGVASDDAEDQQEDDRLCALWDSPPLDRRIEILGAPELSVRLASSAPEAYLIARLCDVHPDGASLRVSYGVLNLAHRDGHDAGEPLEPARRITVQLRLNDVAFAFPPGHRIRLAVSTTYWPIVWPCALAASLTVFDGVLVLPARTPRASDATVVVEPPEAAAPEPLTVLRAGVSRRERGRDIATGEQFSRAIESPSLVRFDAIATDVGMESRTEYRIRPDDPLSARMEVDRCQTLVRAGSKTRMTLHGVLTAGAKNFHVEASLDAYEAGTLVCHRDWRESIPRVHAQNFHKSGQNFHKSGQTFHKSG